MAYGTYADVTGVVDATAAGEVEDLITELLAMLGDPETAPAQAGGGLLMNVDPATLVQIRAEIQAVADAIAAAPTS